VTDVCGIEGDSILLNDIFKFEIQGEDPDGRLYGTYHVSHRPPSFEERLRYFGVERDWNAALAGDLP
jgi:pilus assembly protein CpaF